MNSLKRVGFAFTLAWLFMVFFVANTASAQTTRGSIAGVVTDSAGAVVSGAAVTATPDAGGEARNVTTGDNGEYRIEALNPGFYTVTISAPSFAKVVVERVNVRTSVVTANNVVLKVAATTENITVEASADAIQTETGELSKTIPQTAVKDLPYVSLNPYSLATTLPGVATVAARDDYTNGTSFSVNGLRPRANNYLIDGFDNNDNGIAGQAFQPTNTEAVQEVTVLTNSYSAEFGRGGGSVSNLTFRSGSNNFHGSAWEQYSGSALNALSSEDSELNGLTRVPQFVQNIFGFRVGGPVIKNKLFLFGTSQWTRFYGAQNADVLSIPTEAGFQRLSGLVGNPNVDLLLAALGSARGSGDAGRVAIGTRPGCPAPCNIDLGFFQRTDTGAGPSREWTVRGDYTGERDNIFVRYTDNFSSLSPDLFANPGTLPFADTQQSGPSRIFGAMWAHTFSPTVLNELRFSAQQIDFTFGPTDATLANPQANLPTITLADSLSNFWGGFGQSVFPQGRGHKTFQFQDAVSWSKGAHTMKIGADLAVLLVRDQIPFNFTGLINVSSGGNCEDIGLPDEEDSCTDLANYIDGFLGPDGSASKSFGNPRISVPTTQQAYYFQDSWKARSNLTLDFGVRYEYQPPDASNVLPFPAIDRATLATDPFQTRHEVQPDRNNWAPRFGFAYSPRFWQGLFGENKTVIRGGYGIFYDAFFTNISNNTAGASPNTLGRSITPGQLDGRGQANILSTVNSFTAIGNPLTSVTSVDDTLVNPMTHQWNLNIQRELPLKLTAEVAYVGTRGQRLWISEQLNPGATGARIIPTRGSIVIRGNHGDSNYHGLQTTVTRNVGNLTIRGSYTWSRSIDNGSEVFVTSGGASRWQNVLDPRSDRGPSAFNRTHRAAISFAYMVPFPKDKGVLSYILGGWGASGIVSFQSGTPETIFVGRDVNGDGEATNDRPNVGNPNASINYSESCLDSALPCSGVGLDDGSGNLVDFNTEAPGAFNDFRYIVPASGNGNVTRNNFTYPGRQDWNLSVLKRFNMPYHEGHQLEFRADMFNAFNHPNLGVDGLDGNIRSQTFLDIDSTRRGGREMVLWAKYTF